MCGIVGEVRWDGGTPDGPAVSRAAESLRHRGPDGDGLWQDACAVFGHRRLSILDLSERGKQPMTTRDGRYTIVYNGEFYNYREHLDFLRAKGWAPESSGDTETLLNLFALEGENALRRVNGMFALAIWDAQERALFLARDRFGKKPLYYRHLNGRIVFASELRALAAVTGPLLLDPAGLDAYMTLGYVPWYCGMLHGVRQLAPGGWLRVSSTENQSGRFWDLSPANHSPTEEELVEMLVDSIRLRFVSDVPVGVFLSGGLDSGLITALAAQRLHYEFTTYTIVRSDAPDDEAVVAREVARRCGTRHVEERIDVNLPETARRVLDHLDEPFADSSCLPTYLVSAMAARHGKVVLSGDGGDETFGGYGSYRKMLLVRRYQRAVPALVRRCLTPLHARIHEINGSGLDSFLKLNRASLQDSTGVFAHFGTFMSLPWRREFYQADFAASAARESRAWIEAQAGNLFSPDSLEKHLDLDRRTYMTGDILYKTDRMAMASSIEARCPFLDYRLVELTTGLPEQEKINTRNSKVLLRRIAAKFLPAAAVQKPKTGFSINIDRAIATELRKLFETKVLETRLLPTIFNYPRIENWYRAQLSGQIHVGRFFWALLVFHHWCQNSGAVKQA